MADLDRLQTLTAEIQPPQFDDLVETARRRDRRRSSTALVVAAVVAVGITLGGVRGLGDDRPAPAPTPDRSQPQRLENVADGGVLPAGRYAVVFAGDADQTPRAIIDVPDGIQSGPPGSQSFVWQGTEDRFASLEFWTIARVAEDACLARPDRFVTPGPSVRALADALAAQRSNVVSTPVPVRVDGYRGLYLETSMPRDLDPARCYNGAYTSWTSMGGPATNDRHTGLASRLWIIDVDGEPLVVHLVWTPNVRAGSVAALAAMVDTLDLRWEGAEAD